MKKKGIITAGICCLATALCGLLALQNTGNVSADVATPASVNDTENHFFMETGAAVRKNADSVGIRYTAYVSQEWYDLATQNGATVKFYTAIDKDGNVDENEAVPVEATEALSFGEYDGENTKYEGRTNLYKFTGALTYTNLEAQEWTDEQRTQAYNMQLDGQAYAVITNADTTTQTVNAVQDDNVRSMGEVADFALKGEASGLDDYTATEETMLADYRTTANAVEYVDATYNTLNVGATYEDAKILKVTMADTNDTYTDGTFAFNNDVATANAASDAYATVYTDKGIIETNFKVCKKVIKNVTDWDNAFDVTGEIKGYHYLANDIENYPDLAITKAVSSANSFQGVFDGGGHTANITLTSNNGLFVYLNAATVKNARFNIRIERTSNQNIGIANTCFGNNTFFDLYVNIEKIMDNCVTFAGFAKTFRGKADFYRVVVKTPDVLPSNTASMGAFAYAIENMNTSTGKTTVDQDDRFNYDLYVISSLPLAREAGYVGSVKWTIYAQNKMIDTSEDEVITEADIDTTNKITYWTTEYTATVPKGKVWSFDNFEEMKTASDEQKIDPSKYTVSSYWKMDTDTGYLTWVGNN